MIAVSRHFASAIENSFSAGQTAKPKKNEACISRLLDSIIDTTPSVNSIIKILKTTRYQMLSLREPIVVLTSS
uniref:Uncharacterized protein n=1 Tax=Meloidogyne incognita TaxID=6306 RepID=A0A914MDK3_MELIC